MAHTRIAPLAYSYQLVFFFLDSFPFYIFFSSSIRSQTTSQFTYIQLVALVLLSSMSLLYRISHHICYTTIFGSYTRSRCVAPVFAVSIHVKRLVFLTSFWSSERCHVWNDIVMWWKNNVKDVKLIMCTWIKDPRSFSAQAAENMGGLPSESVIHIFKRLARLHISHERWSARSFQWVIRWPEHHWASL